MGLIVIFLAGDRTMGMPLRVPGPGTGEPVAPMDLVTNGTEVGCFCPQSSGAPLWLSRQSLPGVMSTPGVKAPIPVGVGQDSPRGMCKGSSWLGHHTLVEVFRGVSEALGTLVGAP